MDGSRPKYLRIYKFFLIHAIEIKFAIWIRNWCPIAWWNKNGGQTIHQPPPTPTHLSFLRLVFFSLRLCMSDTVSCTNYKTAGLKEQSYDNHYKRRHGSTLWCRLVERRSSHSHDQSLRQGWQEKGLGSVSAYWNCSDVSSSFPCGAQRSLSQKMLISVKANSLSFNCLKYMCNSLQSSGIISC